MTPDDDLVGRDMAGLKQHTVRWRSMWGEVRNVAAARFVEQGSLSRTIPESACCNKTSSPQSIFLDYAIKTPPLLHPAYAEPHFFAAWSRSDDLFRRGSSNRDIPPGQLQ